MIFVIVLLSLLFVISLIVNYSQATEIKDYTYRLRNEHKINAMYEEQKRLIREAEKLKADYEEKLNNINSYYEGTIKQIDGYIKNKCEIYPRLAGLMADFLTLHYEKSAHFVERKSHPAPMEASRIRELRWETKKIISEKKVLEYKLAYIEKLFPNINDIFDSSFNEESDLQLETEENTDQVRLLLTHEEYCALTETEKNQLALNRYIERRKSNWQIGRDYEMYIGHLLEQRGFFVEYNGIIEKLEDMGRDLIATKNMTTCIIQCKNWSLEKTIHEKHIFQLFGTVVLYRLSHRAFDVKGVFVTTSKLSLTARRVAKQLDIIVVEMLPLGEFPRIKCNINRTTGEYIYHLPFDQQYDRAVISAKDGECYAHTVEEAEAKGFRRAWRHFATT